VNAEGLASPAENRRPTPMMPPTSAVAAQLAALQRNDWPEPDAGARAAFAFALPEGVEDVVAGRAGPAAARSWAAREQYLAMLPKREEAKKN
jgi:hypothetical protein